MTTYLLGSDAKNSPLAARGPNNQAQRFSFSPFGQRKATGQGSAFIPGFNGQRLDPVSKTYHLGNGYRAYNPTLMRFNCPDSMSPFGPGGINPYAYCLGDPINRSDPSGHVSTMGWVGIGLSVLGILFTAGAATMAIAAAGGVMAAISSASAVGLIVGGLGLVADVAGIVSGAVEDMNPSLSATLGWVSLGLGVGGFAAGGRNLASEATRGLRQRLGNIKTTGLSGRGGQKAAQLWDQSPTTGLMDLPNEMIFKIGNYLNINDKLALAATSQSMYNKVDFSLLYTSRNKSLHSGHYDVKKRHIFEVVENVNKFIAKTPGEFKSHRLVVEMIQDAYSDTLKKTWNTSIAYMPNSAIVAKTDLSIQPIIFNFDNWTALTKKSRGMPR